MALPPVRIGGLFSAAGGAVANGHGVRVPGGLSFILSARGSRIRCVSRRKAERGPGVDHFGVEAALWRIREGRCSGKSWA